MSSWKLPPESLFQRFFLGINAVSVTASSAPETLWRINEWMSPESILPHLLPQPFLFTIGKFWFNDNNKFYTLTFFFFCSLSRTAQFFKSIFNCISNIFKAMFQHFQNIVISLLLEIIFYFKKISWLRQNKYPVSAEMLCNICMWSKPNIWLFGLLSILYFICFQVIPKWIPSYPLSLELQVNVILTLDNHLIY